VWLYAPTALDNATWAGWYAELAAHRANVSGVSPCTYLVQSNGSFVSQMPSPATAALAAELPAAILSPGRILATIKLPLGYPLTTPKADISVLVDPPKSFSDSLMRYWPTGPTGAYFSRKKNCCIINANSRSATDILFILPPSLFSCTQEVQPSSPL
jgi:hypothetical protein